MSYSLYYFKILNWRKCHNEFGSYRTVCVFILVQRVYYLTCMDYKVKATPPPPRNREDVCGLCELTLSTFHCSGIIKFMSSSFRSLKILNYLSIHNITIHKTFLPSWIFTLDLTSTLRCSPKPSN